MRIIIARILIAAGICALAFVGALRLDAAVGERSAREDLEVRTAALVLPARAIATDTHQRTEIETDTSEWSEGRRAAWQRSQDADPGTPIGVLSIASLGLSVVLLEGTDEITLNRGVGSVEGTRLESNLGVAGHRDGFFRGLRHIAVGDRIRLEAPGFVHEYEVRSIRVVAPEDVEVLDPTPDPTLTLVTCFPFFTLGAAPKRFIVHAALVGSDGSGP